MSIIITDDNYQDVINQLNSEGYSTGALPRTSNIGDLEYAAVYSEHQELIPESQWVSRIKEVAEAGAFIGQRAKFDPKDNFQNGYSYCFPKDTLIRMADGSEKPIQEICVLDEVVSAEGNSRKVMQVICHKHQGNIAEIKIWGHRHLRCTPNHPILTDRGYIPAENLISTDRVMFTKYLPEQTKLILTSQFIQERFVVNNKRRETTYHSRGCVYADRKVGTWEEVQVPDVIELTYAFGRLSGLFIAEGHTSFGTVYWSFGKHEHDTLATEVVNLLKSEFGVNASIKLRANNVAQVVLHGTRWAKLFEGIFRTGAGNKHVPKELLTGPKEFLEGLITGWRDGDRKTNNSGATISRKLSVNMFDVANALGLLPRFERMPPKIDKNGVNHKEAWVVHWTGDAAELCNSAANGRYKVSQNEAHMLRGVDRVDITNGFDGYVFNLEVEQDNSYVAEGIGVHNCWSYSLSQAVMGKRLQQGQSFVQLSPESLAEDVGFRNKGNSLDSALEYAAQYGIASREFVPQFDISKKNWKSGWEDNRKNYIPLEWWDLGGKDVWAETVTALLCGEGCYVGLSWWSHAVWYDMLGIDDKGRIGVHTPNSHGEGKDVWLFGSKAIPSMGSFVIRSVTYAGDL